MKKFLIWGISLSVFLGVGMYFMIGDSDNKNESVIKTNQGEKSDEVVQVSNVTEEDKGDLISVEGIIEDINESNTGDIFINLSDETGSILVPVFKDKDMDRGFLVKGNKIKVKGKVDVYKNELEIIPQYDGDIVLITNDNDSEIKNTNSKYSSEIIDESKLEQSVVVQGDVISIYEHEDGHLFLDLKTNGNNNLSIPIFESLGYDSTKIYTDANVTIKGIVNKYKDEIQVVPENKNDIVIN